MSASAAEFAVCLWRHVLAGTFQFLVEALWLCCRGLRECLSTFQDLSRSLGYQLMIAGEQIG